MPAPSAPLTIAHVAHTAEHGGAELALARVLADDARDWRARLVIPDGIAAGVFADLPIDLIRAGRRQDPGAARATPWAAVRFGWSLLRQAIATRRSGAFRGADVVHANSTRAAVYTALSMIGTRTPLVVHLRDRIEAEAIGRFGLLAFRLVVARRASGYIANSTTTADTVRPLLGRGRFVEVVPSPIGLTPRGVPLPGGERIRIGMVARLDPWKGQEELIRAYAAAGLDDRASLTLVGDAAFGQDAYARRLRGLVSELGLRHVEFLGFRTDVQECIEGLDVCVQYSTRPEPLGQNVLQYLALGRAVVAAAEGGPTEWIRHEQNGLLAAPNDVPTLTGALRRLVDDEALRGRLGSAAARTRGLLSDADVTRAQARVFARAAGRH